MQSPIQFFFWLTYRYNACWKVQFKYIGMKSQQHKWKQYELHPAYNSKRILLYWNASTKIKASHWLCLKCLSKNIIITSRQALYRCIFCHKMWQLILKYFTSRHKVACIEPYTHYSEFTVRLLWAHWVFNGTFVESTSLAATAASSKCTR